MLHMIIATHTPDDCPMNDAALAKKVLAANRRIPQVSKKLGVTVKGSWTCMPAHMTFMLVDAPNAHVLNEMAIELQLMNWNTSVLYPVTTMEEALKNLK
jgi:hypothetical protein